jgi:type IV fimbrial biogenesis protein FimT
MAEIDTDHNAARRSVLGFTLIELLITIAIASILLAIAVPSFNGLIVGSRLTTQANDFVAAVNFARSEAIKRNSSVSLCRAEEGADDCAGAAGLWQFWIVRSATGTVVRRGAVNTYAGKMMVRSTLTNDLAVFGSDGLVRTGLAMVDDHEISVCATNLAQTNVRRLVLGAASRISMVAATAAC